MALINLTRSRLMRSAALLLAGAALSVAPAFAQEEGPDAPDTVQPGYSSLNVAQPKGTRELQNALQRLALNPADIDALIDGGNAALLLGDPQAAIGFFARADEMSPGNGRVKAGLGSGLLLNENPYEALRLFEEAKRLGIPETVYASDRGLAYDLVGNFDAAQADYELALRRGGDDETIRRYALSLGIAGDRAAAEAQLDPLLRKRDAAAWRTRAFVLAVTGDPQGAVEIADATMPKRMAASIEPFFRFMGKLTPAQQAAAAHFGHFPQSASIGKDDPRNRQYASAGTPRVRSGRADSGLIPVGEPLGPTADSKARKTAKADKSQRRRPGKLTKKEQAQIAAAQAEAAARPVAVPVRTAGPLPPSDLLIPGRGVSSSAPVRVAAADPKIQPTGPVGSSTPAPTRTVSPARVATADPRIQPTGSAGSASNSPAPAPTRAAPPVVLSSVKESVRQPNPPVSPPPVTATTASATAAASPPPPPVAATPQSETRQVQVAGLDSSVRPGFASLAANSPAPPPAVSAPVAGPPAAGLASSSIASSQQGSSFDLARIGPPAPAGSLQMVQSTPPAAAPTASPPGTASMVAAAPPPAAQTASVPARVSLAAVIAEIKVPPQELALDEDAVDITKIKPAQPKPPEPKKVDPKKPDLKKPDPKTVAAKPVPPKHPKRYWVQVAGGANRADLAKEWKRLTGVSPAAFKGKQGWWTPLNATNRLLAGPFGSEKEAQGFVNTLSKQKLSGFAFTSSEGQEVTKLGG